MSRIGKKPISVPKGVTITQAAGKLTAKGPKGELHLEVRPEVEVSVRDNTILVSTKDASREANTFQGTTWSLINGMLTGVTQGYEKKLEINGVGYQATLAGKKIQLALGFSKPVIFDIPSTVTVDIPNPTTILVKGCDKQQVGLVAAAIRKLRKPEPYKGKGIKYSTEVVRRKAGKAFASGGAA